MMINNFFKILKKEIIQKDTSKSFSQTNKASCWQTQIKHKVMLNLIHSFTVSAKLLDILASKQRELRQQVYRLERHQEGSLPLPVLLVLFCLPILHSLLKVYIVNHSLNKLREISSWTSHSASLLESLRLHLSCSECVP